jgi:hypothetical protein
MRDAWDNVRVRGRVAGRPEVQTASWGVYAFRSWLCLWLRASDGVSVSKP